MRRRSSPRDKRILCGVLLGLIGLCVLAIPNISGIVRVVAACCMATGSILSLPFSDTRLRMPNRRSETAPNSNFWLRIVGVVLWLGVVPLAFLWLYVQLRGH